MLSEEEKNQASSGSWKTFSRSMTWTERPPRKTNSKPQWNSKARACLPPLQPLSIVRPSVEEWPKAGSDDLGIWPNPPTPGARPKSLTPRENSSSDQFPREFEFRKDMLAFFDKECSRILDHIYLGSDAIAKNRETLRQNEITHVLNCAGFFCPEYFNNELVYKTLWLEDSPSEDITSILYNVFDYFEDVREQGGRVLVHCYQGVSRSTSLVIAYLMWKEGKSFDDAFQHVKSARGVTNPNVGFACQLLQCQKRVHALPASPTSVLRMYRMAPHSPYDPLHLVPKMLSEPGVDRLDSRGAFIVQIPSALYVWTGKFCSPLMLDQAKAAAAQFVRYERVRGPVIIVKEGEETFEFWDVLRSVKSEEENRSAAANSCLDQRKLDEYDLDFENFHRALAGGVVPPFPLSEVGPEICLPARENGWNRLRRKFCNSVAKEFIASSKSDSKEHEDCDSPDSFASYVTSSECGTQNNLEEVGFLGPISDTSLLRSKSFNLVDSFSSFRVSKPESSSTSPSISPSTSDNSSSLTVSPSSSNWSDISCVSAQPSPCRLEQGDTDHSSLDDNKGLRDNANLAPSEEGIPVHHPNRVILPSIDEASQMSGNFTRSSKIDVMRDVKRNNLSREVSSERQISDADGYGPDDGVSRRSPDEKKSIYIILAISFRAKIADALYVWIGHNVSSKGTHGQMFMNDCTCEDNRIHLEIFGRDLLIEEGFRTDQIKIVKEGEEPVQLLKLVARDDGVK
ncbi:hypothetical protein BUALT_Bualt05G0164700 [Buddleja alternifolia]|uniref:Uncharacterized protein n=1 Tax=Buddleja alternifolia TaxID=168488 RepID=A0AAV6XJX9_9LAMI|nr:hypothetical protein BUALT_Bualt05G0164700 [Buddleja alternifolia]